MAILPPTPAEVIQGDLAYLLERDQELQDGFLIPRHPLLRTTQLAGGLTVRQTNQHYLININHTNKPNVPILKECDNILRSQVELYRNGTVGISVQEVNGGIDKYEEQLAYAMSAYLPERIIMQALRHQPKTLTVRRPLDDLDELIDFLDFTTKYGKVNT